MDVRYVNGFHGNRKSPFKLQPDGWVIRLPLGNDVMAQRSGNLSAKQTANKAVHVAVMESLVCQCVSVLPKKVLPTFFPLKSCFTENLHVYVALLFQHLVSNDLFAELYQLMFVV